MFDSPCNCCVARDADTVRVRDDNRPFQKTAFFDPRRPSHFAIAIQTENAGVNRIVERIVSAGQDCRHAGANWPFADFELAFAFD